MFRRALLVVPIILAFAACEKEPLPGAVLRTDRDSLGFGAEFGSGAFVGTSVTNTLTLWNEGIEDLVIDDIQVEGQYFRLNSNDPNTPLPVGTAIQTYDRAFIQVFFEPDEAGEFLGTMTITSNSAEEPTKTIGLTGVAEDP
jgi:hypothetical protein